MHAFCLSTQKAMCIINVKDYRQPINPIKVSYLLINSSFFRRQAFMWLETQPELTNNEFYYGYGQALYHSVGGCNVDRVRKWLGEQKVLEKEAYYTSFYEIESITTEELMKNMGLKK